MHLSRRQRLGKEEEAPRQAKPQAPRRTRTQPKVGGENAAGTTKPENPRPKRFRVRNPSLSSTEERRGAAPRLSTTATAGSADQESCIALLSPSRPAAAGSRAAEWSTGVSRSGSLPSLFSGRASPRIARNKTFVFMYDEEERKSRAVKQPDELNIGLPVLVQYDLAEEDTNWTRAHDSSKSQELVGAGLLESLRDANYSSPTVDLLQKWDKNEKRNKGMHVMKWLVQVQS